MSILIIGANSAIAAAITQNHLDNNDEVFAVSRHLQKYASPTNPLLHWLTTDHSENHIESIIDQIDQKTTLSRIYICIGLLHNECLAPEKRLDDFSLDKTIEVYKVNTLLPMLWLKHIKKIVRKSPPLTIITFSARVGSISDNTSGGWYSYRSSKAALNMLLKSAAIELHKLNKNIKLLAFHPGTVKTPLSEPFQKSIISEKLFSPRFVANQLEKVISQLNFDGQLSYLDWQGEPIEF